MSKSYGRMVGYSDAIAWVEALPESETKGYVLARMRYEADKAKPVKMRFIKGRYGHKYDSWQCGNCGSGILEAHWKYCPNCGFAILREG